VDLCITDVLKAVVNSSQDKEAINKLAGIHEDEYPGASPSCSSTEQWILCSCGVLKQPGRAISAVELAGTTASYLSNQP